MEDSDELPPYWQPPATIAWRQRRRGSSPLLNSSLMIILLPSLLLLFTVFIVVHGIPRFLPHFHNKPTISNNAPDSVQKSISLKKSWDFLNIILVLFAILCGIFAKRNDDLPSSSSSSSSAEHDQIPAHNHAAATSSSSSVLLQKSKLVMNHHHHHHQQSSSAPQWFDQYSQHQQTSPTLNTSPVTNRLRRTVSSDPYLRDTRNNQFRFFDDLDVNRFYPNEHHSQPQPSESVQVDDVVKDIQVDTFVLHNTREELPSPPQTPPHNPTTPPPPPPPPPAKQRRTFQTLPRRERAPPAPPPPPRGREGKKRSGRKSTTKDIATAIVSLYSHKKRKQRLKSSRNHEEPQPSQTQSQMAPPPSPPPPPPPPPSVFHNLFKKTKKIHSLSSTPTTPPPPSRRHKSAGKPPLPTRKSGNESPMNGIPAAPPRPPMKLAVEEMDGGDESGSEMKGKDGTTVRMTCPSPDVNLKADTFIARHHNGWRLEKLNSWREKHNHNKAGTGSGEW